MTTSNIIDLFQSRVKSQSLMINKSTSLNAALKRIEKIGLDCKLNKNLIEASMISFGLQQRYNARIDLNSLQQASSPDAARLAVLYSSQQSVWSVMKLSDDMTVLLKSIDSLMALGRNAPDDQQLAWAEAHKFGPIISSIPDNTADLNNKRYKFLRDALMKTTSGVNIYARDSHLFVFLSQIAIGEDPDAITEFYGVNESGEVKLHKLNSTMAKELLREFQNEFSKNFLEYQTQLEAINQGKYSQKFNFTI